MENTKIEWCSTLGPDVVLHPGNTFNPWWGCIKVSPACENCYAENFANRFHPGLWGPAKTTPRKIASEEYWKQPLKWNAKAKKLGVQLKVFCASMSDVFENHPQVVAARWRLFYLIEATPNLNWLLLTKRPENIMEMVPKSWDDEFPENIWVGTTVESQEYADKRIPELLKVPAKVRFLSMEPLKGPVNLTRIKAEVDPEFPDEDWRFNSLDSGDCYFESGGNISDGPRRDYRIDWVIAGGESGQQASPSHPDWFRYLRDQCGVAAVPFFFKQFGEWAPGENGRLYREKSIDFTDGQLMINVGKKAAGRLLDGVEYNEMPV
jgi:protein gp37